MARTLRQVPLFRLWLCLLHSRHRHRFRQFRKFRPGSLQYRRLRPSHLGCGLHSPFHRKSADTLIRAGKPVTVLHNNCSGKHAGMLLLARVLQLGARLARPGEFSERAFLNDKLDLAQAEAVADLIDSGSREAARAAMRSLQGEFSERIRSLSQGLIEEDRDGKLCFGASLGIIAADLGLVLRPRVRQTLRTFAGAATTAPFSAAGEDGTP